MLIKGGLIMNCLDVYNFINSQAIQTHCRKIEHKFSSVEAAYLIWASESHTVKGKHNAFLMLIKEFPDMEIAKRPWTPHIRSLHSFLKQFIQIENKYNRDRKPFVLDKILYWENAVPEMTLMFLRTRGDESDLMADIYGIADDDTFYRDHGPSYLDMEYYEKELEGFERILAVLSGFLKNEYNVAVLIEAYEYLKNEEQRKILYDYLSAYRNPYLIAAGFKEKR